MSRRYDTRTTIFSPQGRLFQVEYAMQAINSAGTCVGVVYKDGVLLGSEKRVIDKLLDTSIPEKIYKVSSNIICGVAGVTSDATSLINQMRIISQRYYYKYQESVPCEQLVIDICNIKQQYTQIGGHRPFGVSLLYAGWDHDDGFQLFQSDPSGNYSNWKATCIGKNSEDGISLLKEIYQDNTGHQEALEIMAKILHKTIDRKPISSENVEIAYVSLKEDTPVFKFLTQEEVDAATANIVLPDPSQQSSA